MQAILKRIYALKRPQSSQALFCNGKGKPYRTQSFVQNWYNAMNRAEAAGVERFHEHDIRATIATSEPQLAQLRLGHKHQTTTDIYLRNFDVPVVVPFSRKG